ncbi:hypothetical protein ACP4TB_28865 [Streptomyces sp. DR3-1]|uniref:hypothetical protein n=1 Tax=Streptomyces sp. DR3-1 TaxID=2951169 RepID=UPI0020449EB4|nr:hypothetical protein [Streptomyces sp. DR3-1]MCM3822283.1 hypothetical protein [Streptomyces sp. DR3-1]
MTEPRPGDTLRDRIAEAIADATGNNWPAQAFLVEADAVMAVLPAPADRATVLREAADRLDRLGLRDLATRELRRMADEAGTGGSR